MKSFLCVLNLIILWLEGGLVQDDRFYRTGIRNIGVLGFISDTYAAKCI